MEILGLPLPDMIEYHRLKTAPIQAGKRPIILKLSNFWDKKEILRNAYKLRGSSIYLKEDLSNATLRKQVELRPFFNIARKDDNRTRYTRDGFLYRGKFYNKENIHTLPLDTREAFCRTRNGVTVFSGTPCMLSNLHDIEIQVDGASYNSSEQYYQSQKCFNLNSPDLAEEVMQAKTGYDCMVVGNKLRPPHSWTYSKGVEIMKKVVTAKFEIEECKDFLLSKQGIIAEATMNKRWGTGVSFSRREATEMDTWNGSNLMGEILTNLRDSMIENWEFARIDTGTNG